jgi:transcriptional regulator with XRE-family HTH domain
MIHAPRRRSPPDAGRSAQERRYILELGQRMRTLREERNLTQQALARRAGIAVDMVSRLENAHYTSPGLRTLLRVAEGLGVPMTALLPDGAVAAPGASPENLLRTRLVTLLRRSSREDLELVLDLAAAVVSRRNGSRG